MALSTLGFGRIFRSLFFEVLGTIFACAVVLLWCVVATATGRGAWNGKFVLCALPQELTQESGRGRGAKRGRCSRESKSVGEYLKVFSSESRLSEGTVLDIIGYYRNTTWLYILN